MPGKCLPNAAAAAAAAAALPGGPGVPGGFEYGGLGEPAAEVNAAFMALSRSNRSISDKWP